MTQFGSTIVVTTGGEVLHIANSPLGTGWLPFDTFARADGPETNWLDIADAWPSNFDPAIVNDRSWSRAFGGPTLNVLSYVDTGLADNFRIVMRWLADDNWPLSALNQVGPALFVDPTVADNDPYLAMMPTGDFTLDGLIGNNNVPNMTAEEFNAAYATASFYWDGNFAPIPWPEGPSTWDVRVVAGELAVWLNGVRVLGPVAVPAQYAGRTMHGLSGRVADELFPVDRIADLCAIQPYTTPLPAYPDPVAFAFGTGAKASSASSIGLTYPAMAAGRQVYAATIVDTAGAITAPAGWHEHLATATGGLRVQVFHRDTNATGSDSGTVTFTKASGTGALGGVIFSTAGENPLGLMVGSGSGNAASSTTIAVPQVTVIGKNRTALVLIGCAANDVLTDPTGYTPVFALGTSGAAVNLSASTKVLDAVPQAHIAVTGAARATAGTSVGQSLITYPDPTE